MDWVIRGGKPSDFHALQAFFDQNEDHIWGTGAIGTALVAPEARVRLAEVSPAGALVGFVFARRVVDLLEIDLVGVHRAERRRGLARSMLADLIEDEIEHGIVEARLEFAESNDPAWRLYAGLGFVVVGRRKRYYPDGADALLMSRST